MLFSQCKTPQNMTEAYACLTHISFEFHLHFQFNCSLTRQETQNTFKFIYIHFSFEILETFVQKNIVCSHSPVLFKKYILSLNLHFNLCSEITYTLNTICSTLSIGNKLMSGIFIIIIGQELEIFGEVTQLPIMDKLVVFSGGQI